MLTGTVIFLLDRGFGFLKTDEPGNDVFFHRSRVVQSDVDAIRARSRVTYELGPPRKGKVQAVRVKLVEQPQPTDDALASLAWEHRKDETSTDDKTQKR